MNWLTISRGRNSVLERVSFISPKVAPLLVLCLFLTACPEVSVDPTSGPQGADHMVIDVFGTNTNFRQGQTAATFTASGGPSGIVIHPPVEVLESDHLQLTISIPADEPIGPQTLEVVTGNERAETEFRVDPQPSLEPLVPDAAEQGDTATVTVTGVETHFTADSCPLSPRMLIQGVEVVSWQAPVDDLTFDMVVSVAMDAPVGVVEGAFELDCDYQTLSAAFEVLPAVRTITIVPSEREQGTTGIVTIEANKADFESFFDIYFDPPDGIDIGAQNVISATIAEVEVVVHSYADPTVRTLGVIDPYGAIEGDFRVAPDPTPPSVSFDPAILRPGDVTTVDANGLYTSFSASDTTVNVEPADGLLTLTLITSPGPTPTLAQLAAEVAPTALEQEYLVTLSTGAEHVQSSLWVVPEPSITILPLDGHQDEDVLIQVDGDNTHFDLNTTNVVLPAGSGLSYSGLDVTDSLNASFTLHIPPDAQTGDIPGAITLETPISAGIESVSTNFRVLNGIPAADLIPTGVVQGSQGFTVQADGRYTHWINNGDTTLTLDPACQGFITIHDVVVANQTELSFQVDVALLAPANTVCAIDIVTDDGVIREQVQTQLTVLPGGTQVQLPLPQTIQGTVDGPQLYSIDLNQGDVLRARASCDPVLYLDPTLTMYAPGGNYTSAPIAYNEDEHAATDDALIVYQATTAGTYYLVVQDRLGFEVGDFTLSLAEYHLVDPTDPMDSGTNYDRNSAQPMSGPVIRGGIDYTLNPRWYSVDPTVLPTASRTAVQVIAQAVSPFETSGADVLLQMYNATTLLDSSNIGTETPDPVLYVNTADLTHISLVNDVYGLSSTTYWLNLRPWLVINEIYHDEVNDWQASFVELYGEPGVRMASCNLVGKVHNGSQESTVFDISLDGSHILESGYYVVAHDDLVPGVGKPHINADLQILNGAYVSVGVFLECNSVTIDRLCWRSDQILDCTESAVPDATTIGNSLGRGYHVDTNDNLQDFLPQPEPSPWNRNLREVW